MFSEKRAITPVIATLLMIAITVAAVAGFYIFYNSFIKQQRVSGDNPSITISGPSMATQGDTISLSVKNSGNVEFDDLTVTQTPALTYTPSTWVSVIDGTPPLKVGGSVACTVTLPAPSSGTWKITITAETASGTTVADALAIEEK